jgi:ornithine carbamoyltransferase
MPKRDLLSLRDLTRPELTGLLAEAARLKAERKRGVPGHALQGKTLALVFHKPSLRTRVSFEAAMFSLGGRTIHLSNQEIGIGTRESVEDIARVLSRYVDGIMIRTFGHDIAEKLAAHASVPVVNGLTDLSHPCQILADLETVLERKGRLEGVRIAYVGDGNNVVHSWMEAASRLPFYLAVATPEGFEPDAAFTAMLRKEAPERFLLTRDPGEAAEGADVLYTDVWASMGQEAEAAARKEKFRGYAIDAKLLARAKGDAIVLHCLPAHRGEEIAADVIDGPQSAVFDQAENRMHAQAAVLLHLLGGK